MVTFHCQFLGVFVQHSSSRLKISNIKNTLQRRHCKHTEIHVVCLRMYTHDAFEWVMYRVCRQARFDALDAAQYYYTFVRCGGCRMACGAFVWFLTQNMWEAATECEMVASRTYVDECGCILVIAIKHAHVVVQYKILRHGVILVGSTHS